jgi:hypothetical protein
MQRYPKAICYRRLHGKLVLLALSDSAFKKEDESGHALKGGLFLLIEEGYREGNKGHCHLLEFVCSRERHVTRSTFGAELFSACDVADFAMLLACLLHQIKEGSMSPAAARRRREAGGWNVEIDLGIDAYSVFAATTAGQVKAPAEKALLSHVQYLRELLDRHILTHIAWFDTRDMATDGLTKGAVDRTALHGVMDGMYQVVNKHQLWKSKLGTSKFALAHLQGDYDEHLSCDDTSLPPA